MVFSLFNTKKNQNGEDYLGIVRAKIPRTRTSIQSIGFLIAPDIVLASASSIFSFPKQTYYDDITFKNKDDLIAKVIDYRVSVDLDMQARNGGFALLKLQRKLKNQRNLELYTFSNQSEKMDVISINTKFFSIFSHEIVNFRVGQQNDLLYRIQASKDSNLQKVITGAPIILRRRNKQKLLVLGIHLGTIKLNNDGSQSYGLLFQQKHFQILQKWQRQMMKQSRINISFPLAQQVLTRKNRKTQTTVQKLDQSTECMNQNVQVILTQKKDEVNYKFLYQDLKKQLDQNEYLSLDRQSNEELQNRGIQLQDLKKKYLSLKLIMGNLYRVHTIQDIQAIRQLYQNHLQAENK